MVGSGADFGAANALLELSDLLVGETTCDGKKKMYELLAEDRPMHVLELPQKPDDPDALEHWIAEIRKLVAVLEERYGVEITEERLRDAIASMNRERGLRRRLAALLRRDDPPLTGRRPLDLKSSNSCIGADLDRYGELLARHEESAAGAGLGGRVRVLMTGVPVVSGAERVIDLVEAAGGLVVAQESCTGLKPILDDVDESAADPIRAIAEKYLHLPCSVMTPNDRRMDLLRRLAEEYRPDCVIDLIWQACITYDVESRAVKRLCEEELGLPFLKIETDYTPSDSARIGVRVEALFETVRARKG